MADRLIGIFQSENALEMRFGAGTNDLPHCTSGEGVITGIPIAESGAANREGAVLPLIRLPAPSPRIETGRSGWPQ